MKNLNLSTKNTVLCPNSLLERLFHAKNMHILFGMLLLTVLVHTRSHAQPPELDRPDFHDDHRVLVDIRSHAQTFCSTPSSSSNMHLLGSEKMKAANANSYVLKVYFHVIRRSNGTGGVSTSRVREAFNILNQDFESHNISFVWDNHINYINNNNYYYDNARHNADRFFNEDNHQDGIDIYLFDEQNRTNGGRANGVGESTEMFVSGHFMHPPYTSLTRTSVVSHEMGHVLALFHTHHGTDRRKRASSGSCEEWANRDNSETCGDFIPDTPADPNMNYDVSYPSCQWRGGLPDDSAVNRDWSGWPIDSNGQRFNPDENIIMSYSHVDCQTYFTAGQGKWMRNASVGNFGGPRIYWTANPESNIRYYEVWKKTKPRNRSGPVTTRMAGIAYTNSYRDNELVYWAGNEQVSYAVKAVNTHNLKSRLSRYTSWVTIIGGYGSYSHRKEVADNSHIAEPLPESFALHSNYPNPFNPTTRLDFDLPETARVSLKVYNLMGQEVGTLVDESMNSGFHSYIFEASGLASGFYIARIQAIGNSGEVFTRSVKMHVVK